MGGLVVLVAGWDSNPGAFIVIYDYIHCSHANFPVPACRNSSYRLHKSFCHTLNLLFIYKIKY